MIDLHNKLFDQLTPQERKELNRTFRPRMDGNYDLKRPVSLHFAWKFGAWREWFKSHRIHDSFMTVMNRNGEGCMPNTVALYRVVYHLGPLKITCG